MSPAGKRALLVCLGILLLLEFGAARRDWLWQLDPRQPVGIMLAVEEQLIAPAGDVRVVILGSSVMRDALLPRAFEQAAGLPPGSVLNTSLPNGTPFDFVLLYERNRDVFRRARLIIASVEDWYFYEEPGVSERYHRWATLAERWADYQGGARLPVLVSWVWKTYAARQAFAVDALAAAWRGDGVRVIGDDGRVVWRPAEQEGGPASFDLSPYEQRLRGRQWRDRQARYLRKLAGLVRDDGKPLLIVRMPMRTAAFARRAEIDPDAEARLQGVLASLQPGASGLYLLDYPTGASAGLEEQAFLDERHLGTRGAERFTRVLAAWAAANYDLR